MSESQEFFQEHFFEKSLSDFTTDFANGGAIRHLANHGFTVPQIMKQLDFPMSKDAVSNLVWKHYVETGKICLKKPESTGTIDKITYVKDVDKYGRTSLRQTTIKVPAPNKGYFKCDFGKRMYQDKEKFINDLNSLLPDDRDYVLNLPWPLNIVYHEADERMTRIMAILAQK